MGMNIEKLIDEITDQVYARIQADTAFAVSGDAACLENLASQADLMIADPADGEIRILQLCGDAAELGFGAVCVNSSYTGTAAGALKGTGVKVCTLAGYPSGAASLTAKAAETLEAVRSGAEEIELVVNPGAVRSHDWRAVRDEISAAVRVASGRAKVKAVIGTADLTPEELVKAAVAAEVAGSAMVVIQAEPEGCEAAAGALALVKQAVGPETGIKICGITDVRSAAQLLSAGACRIGICKKEK